MLTEKQKRMVDASKEIESTDDEDSARASLARRLVIERNLRRMVHDTVIELIENVDETILKSKLRFLHPASWDEVVEERSLDRQCGLPICERNVEQRKMQKYHIDRRHKKIYEVCTERGKFCSDSCFQTSCSIRAQLDPTALWLTGETPKRTNREFTLSRTISDIDEDSKQRMRSSSSSMMKGAIEIVGDNSVTKLSELIVREAETESDEDQTGERTVDDGQFLESLRRFVIQCPSSGAGMTPKAKEQPTETKDETSSEKTTCAPGAGPKTPAKSPSQIVFDKERETKLAKLRAKYGKPGVTKPSVSLIEPVPISGKLLKENLSVPQFRDHNEDGFDTETMPHASDELAKALNLIVLTPEDILIAKNLLVRWWTERSGEVLRLGGATVQKEALRIMEKFCKGIIENEEEMDVDRDMPENDKTDAHRRRIQILHQTMKPIWLSMERFLRAERTYSDIMYQLLSTFRLEADTVAGIEPMQMKLICVIIYRIICLELNDTVFFSGRKCSAEVVSYLDSIGLECSIFNSTCNLVFQETNYLPNDW